MQVTYSANTKESNLNLILMILGSVNLSLACMKKSRQILCHIPSPSPPYVADGFWLRRGFSDL